MSAADSAEVVDRIRSAESAAIARSVISRDEKAWIVGGAVRDALFGAEVVDVDLAVLRGEEERLAKELAASCGGFAFELSAEHRTWRVVSAGRDWHIDFAALRGDSIEEDLRLRDFTVNAMGVNLAGGDGEPIDPTGGLGDARDRKLRAASPEAFADDPLRLLRAARIASAFALELDHDTIALARKGASRVGEPAGERQFAEFHLMLSGPDPLGALSMMDELGLTEHFLPELAKLRGVGQSRNHHLDVHGHTLAVLEQLLEVEADLAEYAGELDARLEGLLAEEVAEGVTRRSALRMGALFHDIGKPATRKQDGEMVTFMGHDVAGAEITREICRRLKVGRRLSAHLEALVLNHLRLGFLVHERPLSRRRIYEYLCACEPVAADVTVLSVADRLSARGSGPIASEEMVRAHLDLAREMLEPALDWHRDGRPVPPIDGDVIIEELGIEPGPEVGEIIEELRAASYAGELAGPDEARAYAKDFARHGR